MFGRKVALKKRGLEAAVGHFTWEERDAMQQKLDAINAAKADPPKLSHNVHWKQQQQQKWQHQQGKSAMLFRGGYV
jgi:hypothetical protein